jgi:hypothetical protein
MNVIASPPPNDNRQPPASRAYRVFVSCTQLYELEITASTPEEAREQALERSHYGELSELDIYRDRHEVFDCVPLEP